MKFSILQENLSHGVTVASRSASAKASLPILNHILLSAEDGRLKISSTNLEIGVNYYTGAKVEEEGSLAVPARVLQDLISSLSPGKVEITVNKGNLHLNSGGVEANIAGIDGSEFPTIPNFPKEGGVGLPAEELSQAINEVSYAASVDENRAVLSGVLWSIEGDKMELVATDGYRLAKKDTKISNKIPPWQVIIPAKTMSELAKIISELTGRGESPDEVQVFLNKEENQMSLKLGNIELSSRLIEGKYPPYEGIIPQEFTVRGVFEKDQLIQSLRLAGVFAKDLGAIVKMSISSSGLELSANTVQLGDEKTTIHGEIEGSEVNVAFNSRYLLDALGHLSSNQVSFEIKSNSSPGVLKAIGREDLLLLVMPVRVQE